MVCIVAAKGNIIFSNATMVVPYQTFLVGEPPWTNNAPVFGFTSLGNNAAIEGFPPQATGFGTGTNFDCGQAEGVRFSSSSEGIAIVDESLGQTSGFVLYQESLPIATNYPIRASGQWGTDVLSSTLTGTHSYEILCVANNISRGTGGAAYQPGQTVYTLHTPIWGIQADSVVSSNYTRFEIDEWYGDSIVAGVGVFDFQNNFCFISSSNFNHTAYISGNPGLTVNFGWANTTNQINPLASRVINNFGRNDSEGLGGVGQPGTFIGDYYQTIVSERGIIGANKMIYNLSIVHDFANDNAFTNYNSAISNLTSLYISNTGDTNALYIPPNKQLTSADFLSDDTHPNFVGNMMVATNSIPYLNIGLR